jgi:tetratricopeptide (TPR) repeat protein
MSLLIALLLAAAPDASAQVREHLKAGQLHYQLGEFDAAAAEFKEAFRIKQEPAILFNVAQAYRHANKYGDAYFYYRQYLNLKPDASNRADVEKLAAEMKSKMDAAPATAATTPAASAPAATAAPAQTASKSAAPNAASAATRAPVAATAPAAATAASAPADAGTPPLHIAGYAALGAGVVAEGLAFVFHSGAQSAADQFNQKYAAGTLTAADAHLKSDAESKGSLAAIALAGGAALLVTGAVLRFAF